MRILEVFSGTKSFSKAFAKHGWECTTIDISGEFEPDICCDVMDLDLTRWEPGYFDYIHCSPPCQNFSIAHTSSKRDLEAGDTLARRSIDIIFFFTAQIFHDRKSGQRPFTKKRLHVRHSKQNSILLYVLDALQEKYSFFCFKDSRKMGATIV